jgi:hypothetical protein
VYSYEYQFKINQKQNVNTQQETASSSISAKSTVLFTVEGKKDSELFFRLDLQDFSTEESVEEDIKAYFEDLISAHPAFFSVGQDGMINNLRFQRNENEWARDLKKGVLSVSPALANYGGFSSQIWR